MPQVQPTEVKAWAFNSTSMNITWRPIEPTRENIRGELIGYRVSLLHLLLIIVFNFDSLVI